MRGLAPLLWMPSMLQRGSLCLEKANVFKQPAATFGRPGAFSEALAWLEAWRDVWQCMPAH